MTREETVRNLLTELVDMIDNGSQKDLDRADEICTSIIRLFKKEPCEDAVSRKRLMDNYNGVETPVGYRKVVDMEVIKNMPSVTPATRWIPVSESFPKEHIYDDGYVEPSETVLVQLNNGEMKTSRYWGSRESRKDEPWIDLSYPTTLEVVAWRPLPNKYSTPHDSRCGN
ncbi:hypothetical protein SAMN05216537_11276 [Lachnospira multipara]|uniref:DUF551 domain-containing protein n=2 Tax=Lachnospira multipara TaxID=28051 RepID=A0A1H5VTQ6_9FIRM|nr:hypothetical protein SAMN05216537_11276 [Lachnospira multipara]